MQRKLQTRIEAQGKYLQAILEKAQKSLSFDINGTGTQEATSYDIGDFNLALSGLMEDVDGTCGEEKTTEVGKATFTQNTHTSAFLQLSCSSTSRRT